MAKKKGTSVSSGGRSNAASQGGISPEQREHMVREAAYFQYMQRGAGAGRDLDDWLAAEAELFGTPEEQTFEQQALEPVDITGLELQKSGAHGAWQDDALKRIVKRNPQKGIPQIESIDAPEAPPRE